MGGSNLSAFNINILYSSLYIEHQLIAPGSKPKDFCYDDIFTRFMGNYEGQQISHANQLL